MPTSEKLIRIGCQSWGYDDWVTKADGPPVFYPRGTKHPEMLEQYARLLLTVEVDSTAYGTPQEATLEGWLEQVPADFLFSLKVPSVITHEYSLDERSFEQMSEFCDRARVLGDRLGVILIQLPASFEPTKPNAQRLREFTERLPPDIKFAVEFRTPGWFVDWTIEELNDASVALAMVEGPWVGRDVMFASLPLLRTPHAYLRIMGERDLVKFDRVYRNRGEQLELWSERISQIAAGEIYIYADNQYEGHAPATVNKLSRLLGLPVFDPSEIEAQASLF